MTFLATNHKHYLFDGNNAYHQFHNMYNESYTVVYGKGCFSISFFHTTLRAVDGFVKHPLTYTTYTTFSKVLRVVSDFMHLMKKIRYRLLSNIIQVGFSEISNIINLDEVKSVLSNVVWSNEKFTKMHDKIPQALFTRENLCTLLKSNLFAAAAYWFPVTMSNIALNTKNVGFPYGEFLLKCAFFLGLL